MNLIQKYKKLLLEAGFSGAKKKSLHYFKETNNYVAFIMASKYIMALLQLRSLG